MHNHKAVPKSNIQQESIKNRIQLFVIDVESTNENCKIIIIEYEKVITSSNQQ